MKYLIMFSVLVFFSCNLQTTDCAIFKKGNYKFANPELEDWILTRSDTRQIEKNIKTGEAITSSIYWLSDCKYTLTFIDVSSSNKEILGKKMEVEILNTTTNSCEILVPFGEETIKLKLIKL